MNEVRVKIFNGFLELERIGGDKAEVFSHGGGIGRKKVMGNAVHNFTSVAGGGVGTNNTELIMW